MTHKHSVVAQQHVSEKVWKEISVSIIHRQQETVVLLHTRLWVPVNLSPTRLFQEELKSQGPDFKIIHVTLRIILFKETHVFLIILSNFSAKPRYLPKRKIPRRQFWNGLIAL